MNINEQVSSIFRSLIRGEVGFCPSPFMPKKANWWVVSELELFVAGWRFIIFIEANWIYDIYQAESPDGRVVNFDGPEKSQISNFLSDDEVDDLMVKLGYVGPRHSK